MIINRNLLVNLCFVLVFSLMAYSAFSYFKQINIINRLTEEFLWQVNTSIQETTRNYLMPAQFIAEVSSQLVGNGVLSIEAPAILATYVTPFAKTYPHLQGFYIGTAEDEFWFWLKEPENRPGYAIQQISRLESGVFNERWRFYDQKGALIQEKSSNQVDYVPTERPWYRGAEGLGRAFWTDVYVFNAKKTPGITGSYPIYGDQGKVVGVWGVDIEIQELSRFLSDVSIARLGEIVILNGSGSVIAYSGKTSRKLEITQLPSLEDLGSLPLLDSMRNFQVHGFGYFFVHSGGQRYLASVSPLVFPNEQNWRVVIAIPENQLLGDLLWRTRINGVFVFLLLAASIVLLVVLRKSGVK